MRLARLTSAVALLLATMIACAESTAPEDEPPPVEPPPTEPPPAAPKANVNGYFGAVPTWETFSPLLDDGEEATGPSTEEEATFGNTVMTCTTTPYSLRRTPEQVVTLNPDVEVLWLGSLLQGTGYVGGIGSLQELPVRQRAPMTVTIDLLAADNSREVAAPTVATVNAAIGSLIQSATTAGHQAGSNIFFTREEMFSYDQMSLEMGLSAKYAGASVKASLSSNISNTRRTITAYFVQRMFTVSMVPPQSPGDVFSAEFTQARLDEEVTRGRMGPENPPVYVSSVAYGRILMFSFSSDSSSDAISATLNALYDAGDFGADLTAEQEVVLATSEIRVATVGGDAQHALDLIRQNNLGAYFAEDAPLSTAKPISYTVRSLKDNTIARVSETTEYNLRDCVPATLTATGSRYTIQVTRVCAVSVSPLTEPVSDGPFNLELYYRFSVSHMDGNSGLAEWISSGDWDWHHRLNAGACGNVTNRGGSNPSAEVRFYFDARPGNTLTFSGTVWDAAWLKPDIQVGTFNRAFSWPAARLEPGEFSRVLTHPLGSSVRVYWRVTKGEDLFDPPPPTLRP